MLYDSVFIPSRIAMPREFGGLVEPYRVALSSGHRLLHEYAAAL